VTDNEGVIKAAYGCFAEGDVAGVLERFSDDVELDVARVLPHGGEFHGQNGAGRFFAGIPEHWESLAVEPERIVASDDHVVVIGRANGRPRSGDGSGYSFVHDFTLAEGRVIRMQEWAELR
jgi:ketosteroid isomerase-like protein